MNIQAIVKTKQQWQSAADLMPQLICLVDSEDRVIQINRTLEWWGLGSVTSAKGRKLHDILHPGCDDPECYFRHFWQDITPARQEGRQVEHDVFDPVRDRHFLFRVQPLAWHRRNHDRTPEDLHTVVIVDDISDRKHTEASVRRRYEELAQQVTHEAERRAMSEEMQARLLTILEKTTDYVAMADVSGALLYLNPAGRGMLGMAPTDELAGKELFGHADPDVRQHLRDIAIPAAIEQGLWAGETRMRDSKGCEIYTSQVIIAHRGADGSADCLSTILRDISERVRTEQALRDSQEELKRLSGVLVTIQEDERRRIALDLHDGLGQSLSLIKLAAQKTAGKVADGKTDEAIDLLDQISHRIREALADVRRVATELRPSILDDLGILPTLSWFFREFEAMCGHIAVEKTLDIKEEDVPVPLKITLYRILQEATSNIIKHAEADRVWVSLYRNEHGLHLHIEDNGRGFNPYCIECSNDTCKGLGLSSMQERVSLSGGSYHLDSSPGFGTRIQASWPLG